MDVAKVLHMNGGIGDSSYAKNSTFQKKAILMTKAIMAEAISALYRNLLPETICIADLGCSSGPNTFLAVFELIKTINNECKNIGQRQLPEFHIFLNDLPGNDFNTIFRSSLPDFQEHLKKHGCGYSNCFVAGVAGSFYNRLYPAKSLHFVHSSYSVHWLSQVPEGIEDNMGNIYLTITSPTSVVKAYYEQFERDFGSFLKYRSMELVKGGRMVLTMLGRQNEDRCSKGCSYDCEVLATTLKSLVASGALDEEKVESFNIPLYNPSPTEVMYLVEKEGSFTIDCLKTSKLHRNNNDNNDNNDNEYGNNMTQNFRAVAEPLLVSHFGDDVELMDQVFNKFKEIIIEDSMAKDKIINTTIINVIVSLTKK